MGYLTVLSGRGLTKMTNRELLEEIMRILVKIESELGAIPEVQTLRAAAAAHQQSMQHYQAAAQR